MGYQTLYRSLGILLLWTGQAAAGGLSLPNQGAAAFAKANAFAGDASDPSALFYNPAGATQLPGTQVMIGAVGIYLDEEYRSASGAERAELAGGMQGVPHIYATHNLKSFEDRLTLGLGLNYPFGLGVDWPDNWQGRFAAADARLSVAVINPVVAYQMTPGLSLAAGLRIAKIDAEFSQKFAILGLGIAESDARGRDLKGTALGWNLAALYKINDTVSAGAQFRSQMRAVLDGRAIFAGPGASVFADTDLRTRLHLPNQMLAGISIKLPHRSKVNLDFEWEGWQTFDSLPKQFEGATQSLLNSQNRRDWRNSFAVKLGGEYGATERLALRAGYFFDKSPIPQETFEPNIPIPDLHVFTVGTGYAWDKCVADLSYGIGFYNKQTIDASSSEALNSAGPTTFGTYDMTAHVLMLSLTTRF